MRRSAERLAANVEARGQRYSNTPIWRELAKEVRRLAEIAALEPQELVSKLSDAYDASLYLGGRLDLDDRIRAGQSEDPALDLDVRGDLAHLVRLAAPWLRNFPSIRKLDDLAAVSLTDFADTASATRVIETAAQDHAIGPDDEQAMRTLAQASDDPEFVGRKARRRLVGGAGNLALSLAVTEAELQADALDLSNPDVKALAEATRKTLIDAGLDIDGLPLPEDVRAALRSLIQGAKDRPVLSPTLPDNVEARARDLILQGIAPPPSWRPGIRRLDFFGTDLTDATPLAGLTALTELRLSVTQITDATPLAGLTGLTTLNLSFTQITDATPLAGLAALTVLNLSGTEITDATLLAGLTALTDLDLSGTEITDVTPLAGLTALTVLNLLRTEITDATPLAGLIALTDLDLSVTQITDVTPLAGLTALTVFNLSVTQITDVTPLAGLSELIRLDLSGTQVTDVTPLAGLTALTVLNLSVTQITDVTPLAGLSELIRLDLSGTQVTDVTPLVGLTALTDLDLSGTQVTDLGPLDGLTSLTKLVPPDAQLTNTSP